MKIYDFKGKRNISGNNIAAARASRHLSQTDLATKMQLEGVNLERSSINKIESGNRFISDYELKTFAKVLRVSLSWLVNEN